MSSSPASDLWAIWKSPAVLLTDFSYVGGIGGAFMNAGLMGILSAILVLAARDYRGVGISAVLMCVGFAFFGKTPLSGAVIVAGTVIHGIMSRKGPLSNAVTGLFGTCLSPLVSYISTSPAGFAVGIAAGLTAGFILPEAAALTKRAYRNMNLYNVGFAAAVIAAVAAYIIKGSGLELDPVSGPFAQYPAWSYAAVATFYALTGILSILFVPDTWKGFKRIAAAKCDGADYTSMGGTGGALLNFALSGLICVAVSKLAMGAQLTGPILGTIIAVSGWAAAAKKPSAMIVLMAGYLCAFFLSSYSTTTALAMGSLYVTGLAPLADRLGPFYGFIAGFMHLFVVSKCSSLHGGLLLYNNGLSAGLVAIVVVAFYKALNSGNTVDL